MRRFLSVLAGAAAACAIAASAHAQCTYPLLSDDVPQTFATTPAYARFVQSAGRWAAAGVRSSGTANWDVGFSLNTAAFPTCLTLPVVASQQTSGIDFVLGDFGTQGTGTRYAPTSRASGAGSGTLEWDSGTRTASIGTAQNNGAGMSNLLDCWNVDLVAGTSYRIELYSPDNGAFKLYAFQRGGANTWRQKSDAALVVPSNANGPHVFTPTTTGKHALVVVNETDVTHLYYFFVQQCAAPTVLSDNVEVHVPASPGELWKTFAITPLAPGFHTVALRPQEFSPCTFGVGPRSVPGALPPCDYVPVNETSTVDHVRVIVGDFASGYLPVGNTYWVGIRGPGTIGDDAWIEYDTGDTPLVVGAAPTEVVMSGNEVVRTFRVNLPAGQWVRVHTDAVGEAFAGLYIFGPFDGQYPEGQGWSSWGTHSPLEVVSLGGAVDFTLMPQVTGPFAFVLTKNTPGETHIELSVSNLPCLPREMLSTAFPRTIYTDPELPYAGSPYGAWHEPGDDWSVIAIRPFASNEDWDIRRYDQPSGGGGSPPAGCLSGPLETTNDPGLTSDVEFLVRREHPLADPLDEVASYFIYPVDGQTPGGGTPIIFRKPFGTLGVGSPFEYFMDNSEIMTLFRVDLTAGTPYGIVFDPHMTAAQAYLFAPASSCVSSCVPEYQRLGDEVVRATSNTTYPYTPLVSGTHLLVLANQIGSEGYVRVGVNPATVGVDPVEPLSLTAPRFESVAPNPAPGGALRFGFALPRPARVEFEIVNLAGRRVARVEATEYAAGANVRAWTAVDDGGRALTPGIYFSRMIVDGVVTGRQKLVVAAGSR